MTNKTEMVSVPRELFEAVAYFDKGSRTVGELQLWAKDVLMRHDNPIKTPAEDVRAVGEEPVRLTAVATLRDDGDGGLEADWLLEGGTSELSEGMILLVAENDPTLCEEDGSAEVYRHPQRPVVLPERVDETQYRGSSLFGVRRWNACIDEFERLNK